MSYYVNRSDGNIAAVVEDGTLNTQTTLKLIGVGYANYAEVIAENFVDLMESFAGYNPPPNPLAGQLWYNKSSLQMQVFDGDVFLPVNNIKISSATPTNSNPGDFWYNSDDMQLLYLRGDQWQVIAPPYKQSQGRSEVVVETLYELNGTDHTATVVYASGLPILIISSDSRYQPHPYIEGYNWINPGINIPSYAQTQNGIFWGGNGNAYASSGITVGGSTGQLQFNNSGFFGGATGLTTNGINLQSTGTISATTITGAGLTSTVSGIRFPDNTVQTTAGVNNPYVLTGNGSVFQVPYFDSARNLTSTAQITTDGLNLTLSNGTLSASEILIPPGGDILRGITFADGSIQYSAAFNNSGSVNGTGSAGQLGYFTSTTNVGGTSQITTNGTDLTMQQGHLRVADLTLYGSIHSAGKITFSDGSIQTTAAGSVGGGGGVGTTTGTIAIVSTLPGTGTAGQTVYNSTDSKLYVYTNGAWLDIFQAFTPAAPEAVKVVSTLPGTATAGDVVFLTSDNKLYKYVNAAWVEVVQTTSAVATVADGAITTAKFAQGITPVEIVATLPTISNFAGRLVYLTTDGKLYRYTGSAFTSGAQASDLAGTITSSQLAANSVIAGKIQAGAVSATEIASGAISTDKLAAGSITSEKITALAVTAAKIATDAITSDKIAANSITAGKISAGAIGASQIAAGVISTDKLNTNTFILGSGYIADAAITTLKVGGNAITQAQSSFAAGQIPVNSTSGVDLISMTVTVSGTQPILVWGSAGFPAARLGTSYDYDVILDGNYWKYNIGSVETLLSFQLGPYASGTIGSYTILPNSTHCCTISYVFANIPAGTYALTMRAAKYTSGAESHSARTRSITMLETKR